MAIEYSSVDWGTVPYSTLATGATIEQRFHVGTTEYDYDIDPVTGAILGKSVEVDD